MKILYLIFLLCPISIGSQAERIYVDQADEKRLASRPFGNALVFYNNDPQSKIPFRDSTMSAHTSRQTTGKLTTGAALFATNFDLQRKPGLRSSFDGGKLHADTPQKSKQRRNTSLFYLVSVLIQLLPIVFLKKIGHCRAGMLYVAEVIILSLPIIYLAALIYLTPG